MEKLLPWLLPAVLVLACPLAMASIGLLGWLVGRLRGRREPLSMSCTGHGHSDPGHRTCDHEPARLEEELARLRSEVAELKARLGARPHARRSGRGTE